MLKYKHCTADSVEIYSDQFKYVMESGRKTNQTSLDKERTLVPETNQDDGDDQGGQADDWDQTVTFYFKLITQPKIRTE